jgi:putative DNA primase/helicase
LTKETAARFLHQAIEANHETARKFAIKSLDHKRILHAVASLQPVLATTLDHFDTHPHLLNCRNGTVDLRTGHLRPHAREDYLTRMVHHDFNQEASCPIFTGFLEQIMGAHADATEDELGAVGEKLRFLQAAIGYSATGDVSAKAVFLAHGKGDNGKTTLLAMVREVLKEYATTIGLDILTSREDSSNIAAARAKLCGVRFCASSETEAGQRFSAAKLKRICQGPGGRIEACRKDENPIESDRLS